MAQTISTNVGSEDAELMHSWPRICDSLSLPPKARGKEGRLKFREDFVDGLESAPEALIGLLKGANFGKLVVRVSDDPT